MATYRRARMQGSKFESCQTCRGTAGCSGALRLRRLNGVVHRECSWWHQASAMAHAKPCLVVVIPALHLGRATAKNLKAARSRTTTSWHRSCLLGCGRCDCCRFRKPSFCLRRLS